MRKALLLIWLGVAVGSGCQATDLAWHRATFAIKEHNAAEKAWRDRRWMYEGVPCPVSFKDGFVSGYRFARGGYDSCEPPTPKHYWRVNGITDEDRLRAQAWTDGFTHGTLAAQQDGCATQSALDAAAALSPPGTPELSYFVPPQEGNSPESEMNVAPGMMPSYPGVPPAPGSPGPLPTQPIPLRPVPAPGAEPVPVPNPAPAPAPPPARGYESGAMTIQPAPLAQSSAAPIPQREAGTASTPQSDWQLPVNGE